MKLLGVLLQTKKGDPLIISSSPALHTRIIILYSNLIYANILDSYRKYLIYFNNRSQIACIAVYSFIE